MRPPELTTAKVINLSEPPSRALYSRMARVARSVISGMPRSAQIAMPQAAVEYVRVAEKERRYDLAILWVGSAAAYATILQGAMPILLSKLSVDAVDARDQRKRHGMWYPMWLIDEWITRRYESGTCRAATAISTVNEEDAQDLVRRYELKNIVRAIPIGVELPQFVQREGDVDTKVVCFVGNLEWGANIDALKWLLCEIIPQVMAVHPQARVRVIGPGGSDLRGKLSGPAVDHGLCAQRARRNDGCCRRRCAGFQRHRNAAQTAGIFKHGNSDCYDFAGSGRIALRRRQACVDCGRD